MVKLEGECEDEAIRYEDEAVRNKREPGDERSTSPNLECMNPETLVLAALVKMSAN